jgi:hypothetical protein
MIAAALNLLGIILTVCLFLMNVAEKKRAVRNALLHKAG